MAKVHRKYRYTWWEQRYSKTEEAITEHSWVFSNAVITEEHMATHAWTLDEIEMWIDQIDFYRKLGHIPPLPVEQNRAKREKEYSIPAGVEDALDWYYA